MKQFFLCLLLVLPAGCASHEAASGGPEAFCQRQAEQDPEVVRLTILNMSVGDMHPNLEPQIRLAQHEALQRCLRGKGVTVRGGVEPVTPR